MRIVDTHAHLAEQVFDADRAEVVARARHAGVEAVIAVGETEDDARRNLELAAEYPGFVLPAAGLFPTILDLDHADRLIASIRSQPHAWSAIGEVGLDYWKVKDEPEREIQREIFGRFVELATELDLPLNVHSRSAGHHVIAFLLDRGVRRVHLHAFDGRASRAQPGVEAGFFFSVPPSVVRSPQKQKLVRRLPLECLLAETDSPVLGADREKRNEPAEVVVAIRAIAELKDLKVERVTEALWENTERLYGLLLDGA